MKRKCDNCGKLIKNRTDPRVRYCDDCKKPRRCRCSKSCTATTSGYCSSRASIPLYAPGHQTRVAKPKHFACKCQRCGCKFKSWRRDILRCSAVVCRAGPKKLQCKECGANFKSSNPRVRFCSECKKPKRCACKPECKAKTKGSYGGQLTIARYAAGHIPETTRKKISSSVSKHWKSLGLRERSDLTARMSAGRRWTHKKQSEPERILHEALDQRIFKYTGLGCSYNVPISVDILAPRLKLIIQVDGCYWHECPRHGSGRFPDKRKKDRSLTKKAEKQGWTVLRFWEHDVRKNISSVLSKIRSIQNEIRI